MSTPRPSTVTGRSGRLPAQRTPWPSGLPLTPLTPRTSVDVDATEPPSGEDAPGNGGASEMSRRPFVRPPADEIDFARVVRRSDLSRRAAQLSWACLVLSGACLVGYLLAPSPVVLVLVILAALTSVGAGAVRSHLDGAAVPRLPR